MDASSTIAECGSSILTSPQTANDFGDAAALYLDLVKRSLINWLYGDTEFAALRPEQFLRPEAMREHEAGRFGLVQLKPLDPAMRCVGRDWPSTAHSMIGWLRLAQLQRCVEDVLEKGVAGDLLEAGVWRGGASILMRAVLKAHGCTDRRVWVADSFAGLPAPNVAKYPQDRNMTLHEIPYLAVSLEQVRHNFAKYGLLDDQVRFLPGWFRDTLPTAPIERLAVLRLDGDLYESTLDTLTPLYPKVSLGGYVIADDYVSISESRAAVDDYRRENGIVEPIVPIDWAGAYWQRTAAGEQTAKPENGSERMPAEKIRVEAMTAERAPATAPVKAFEVFYHVACLNHWRQVVAEQMNLLSLYGLNSQPVRVGILGTDEDCQTFRQIVAENGVAVEIVAHEPDLRRFELPTRLALERWARRAPDDSALFYFHSKGVGGAPIDPLRESWRRLMNRYLIPRWRDLLRELNEFDLIGVNWHGKDPDSGDPQRDYWKGHPHFSGNFWWARADWIKRLPPLQEYYDNPTFPRYSPEAQRVGCEFWIGSAENPRVKSLYCHDKDFCIFEGCALL